MNWYRSRSSSFKTTDFFAVNPFIARILLCDQLRICFKQQNITIVLNSYLVQCLSTSTSSNTSSVRNFVQSHSMLKLALNSYFVLVLFTCFARSGYISVRTAFDILMVAARAVIIIPVYSASIIRQLLITDV